MIPLKTRLALAGALFAALAIPTGEATAQMSNRPFSFGAIGSAGVGMSNAGRQAILNQELNGATPRVLLRGPSDTLLIGPVQGPGRSALVFSPDGSFLPGYRRDFRRGDPAMAVGVFNAFFVPRESGRSHSIVPIAAASDAVVNTWTARVLTGAGVGYGPASPVTVWTGAVY